MTTGLVWHERYMWHDTRHAAAAFPVRRLDRARHARREPAHQAAPQEPHGRLGAHAAAAAIEPRMATVEEICRFHERAYVDHIKALSDDNGGDAGGLTPFGPGSYEIALLSAGGVIAACDAVLDGEVDNVYALCRPPGPPRARRRGHGLLHLRQRLGRRAPPAHGARARRASRSSTGTSITATAPRARSTTIPACSRSRCTRTAASRSSRAPSRTTARARARAPTSTSRCRAAAAAAPTSPPSSASSCPRSSASRPTSSSSRTASTPARWIRSAACRCTPTATAS